MIFKSEFYRIAQAEVENTRLLKLVCDPNHLNEKNPRPISDFHPIIFETVRMNGMVGNAEDVYADFNEVLNIEAHYCNLLVVSKKMAAILQNQAQSDIQRIPAIVDGCTDTHEVIHILSHVDCIDYNDSVITSYWPSNPLSPRGLILLIIDKTRVIGHNIFRVKHYEDAIVISRRLRQALGEEKLLGGYVEPVATPTNELKGIPLACEYFGARLSIKRAPPPKDIDESR